MPVYGKGSPRQPKKQRGVRPKQSPGLTRYYPKLGRPRAVVDPETGKLVAPIDFSILTLPVRKVERTVEYYQRKREAHLYIKQLFRKPVNFKTTDGKSVRILSHGVENLLQYSKRGSPPRALVAVFVEGRVIFYYRSSGESSRKAGVWFPTSGMLYGQRGIEDSHTTVLWIKKLSGHGDEHLSDRERVGRPGFPKWVMEVGKRVEKEVDAGRIKLVRTPDLPSLQRFESAVRFFPTLETEKRSMIFGRPILPP
jgi:hypothetical protein